MRLIIALVFAFVFLFACASIEENNPEELSALDTIITKSLAPELHTARNPYELKNMQLACDSLCNARCLPRKILAATDYYVKVNNLTIDEYEACASLGIELFQFPLGGENAEEVIDSTLLYCVVRNPSIIPTGISYEIIDTCFIPSNYDILNALTVNDDPDSIDMHQFFDEVESLSCALYDPISASLRSSAPNLPPTGHVELVDSTGIASPLKGVKVCAHYWVNTASAYTDNTGAYTMDKPLKGNPRYIVTFSNTDRYLINTILSPKYPLSYNYLWHDKRGYNITINESEGHRWNEGVMFNAIWDYYAECTNIGKTLPPSYLRCWCGMIKSSVSATWMLNHIINICHRDEVVRYLSDINCYLGDFIDIFFSGIRPDLFVYRYDGCTNRAFCSTIWHELNHASHFSQAGWQLWTKMYAHIARSKLRDREEIYGLGLDNDETERICELVESWAYAVEKYSCERFYGLYYGDLERWGSTLWFRHSAIAIYTILHDGVLSEAQVLACMDASVKSVNDLFLKLIEHYPSKAAKITRCFVENNALPNYTKWTLKNQTSINLYINLGFGSCSESVIVPVGGSYHLFSAGIADASCQYLLSYTPSLFPYSVRIQNALGEDIFWRENGVVFKPLSFRPFLNSAEWAYSAPVHYDVGNRTEYNYTFFLTDSDL